MIKAIMAVDEKGGISKGQSMPWPKNSIDLKWFKENTINNVVVMGRKTWEDPFMPTPLKSRINVLITSKDKELIAGADYYLSGDINRKIKNTQPIRFYGDPTTSVSELVKGVIERVPTGDSTQTSITGLSLIHI